MNDKGTLKCNRQQPKMPDNNKNSSPTQMAGKQQKDILSAPIPGQPTTTWPPLIRAAVGYQICNMPTV